MKTILVTGGAGYIGSHTLFELIEQGFKTIVIDSLENGHKEFLPSQTKFFKINLLNLQKIKKVFKENKIDAVIHFAGYIAVGEGERNPHKYYSNNIISTLNLLEAMLSYGVKKIVFSSSAAVYGIPKKIPIKEDSPTFPINVYGKTKLFIENILKDYFNAYNLSSISLRYFNAAGADPKLRTGEWHNPETHVIPLLLESITEKKTFNIFGDNYDTPDGTCIRDYIHVCDLAAAHVLAVKKLLKKTKINEAINLGSNTGYSVKELVKTVERITGKKAKVKTSPRRPGDPPILIADNLKAQRILGWKPKYNLTEIIKTAWEWHKKIRKCSRKEKAN